MVTTPRVATTIIVLDGTYSLRDTGVIPITARIETEVPPLAVVAKVRTAGFTRVTAEGDEVIVKVEHMRGAQIDEVLSTLRRLTVS